MLTFYHQTPAGIVKSTSIAEMTTMPREAILWVDLNCPSQSEEQLVEEWFQVEIQTRQEAEEIEYSSRYFEGNTFTRINSSFLTRKGDALMPDVVSFVIQGSRIISYRCADLKAFADTVRKFKVNQHLFQTGIDFMLSIFENRIDMDADLLESVAKEITEISRQHLKPDQTDAKDLVRINALQENVMRYRENIIDNQRSVSAMLRSEVFEAVTKEKLRIMIKDIGSLVDYTAFSFERLEYMQNTLLGLINLQQNTTIKIFTVVTVIFMPPTLIASLYGMNFRFMPELEWSFGYPLALGLMIGSSLLTFWIFKRNRWL
ncbi:MAG: magnesium/cobalt transporter CorA [Bacteroidia bacterium]|nr:magnesium/cobalt transporter CorA [Bacteroidia bacterium]